MEKIVKDIALLVIFGVSGTVACRAGGDYCPLGARPAGMAATSVVLTDIWASANNQAGLGFVEQPVAAMYYENRMNVKSLSLQAGVFAIPVKSVTVGVNYRYFGFSKYNELKFGLAVGKKLGDKFALGVQMDYFRTHFSGDYGNFGVLCGEIGLLYEPAEHLIVGAHLFNVSQSRQKASLDERLPTVIRFGAGYVISDKLAVSMETEKDVRMDAIFRAGMEYSPIDSLFFRCGLSTGYMYQYAFGLGYNWSRFTIDAAFSHHRVLGYSPHVSLIAKL
jgi:hypothetical protein